MRTSQEQGEEAKKLTRETYEDIMKVLEDKARKAKELASREAKEKA